MSNKQVTGTVYLDNIKRCYMDIKLNVECPKCKKNMLIDLDSNYLMHPNIGESIEIGMYCDNCIIDWKMPLKLVSSIATIEYDTDKIEKDVW